MSKYPKKLSAQLKLFNIVTRAERRRIISAYEKYGESYRTDNMIDNAIEEILDAFGYLCMEKMKQRIKNKQIDNIVLRK